MRRRALVIGALITGMLAGAPAHAGEVGGTPRVIDGRTLEIAGRTIVLARIAVPAPGSPCRWRGRPVDCGRLAVAGLMDLVAGSTVICRPQGAGYTCLADGYDLAFGLVHAGWAVPLADAPAHWFARMREAERRRRGLWNATDGDGRLLAPALTR